MQAPEFLLRGFFRLLLPKRKSRRTPPPEINRPKRSTARLLWQPLIIVFVVAAVIRLIVATQLWDLPIVRTPKLDSFEYVSWARRMAAGDFSWPAVSPHGPGYPLFLAAMFNLGGGSLPFAIAVQAVLGAITAALVAVIARRWRGDEAAWYAGLAFALYGPAVYIDTAILAEGLLLFLLVLALLLLSRAPITFLRAVAAGAVLGAAVLVRPTAAIVLGAVMGWLLIVVRRHQPHVASAALALAAAAIIVVAPAVAETWSTSHSLSLQGYGGMNFYIGNSPVHDGRAVFRLGAGWDGLNSEAVRAGISDPAARDWYYVAKTLAEIRQRPGAFLRLMVRKLLWTIQSEEIRDSHSFYFFARQSWLLRMLLRMAILLPLACIGLFVTVRTRFFAARHSSQTTALNERHIGSLLAVYATGAVASVVFLVVGTRYRMPLVPALALASAAALTAIVGAIRTRDKTALAVYAVVASVAIVASHTLTDPANRSSAEEWAFTGSALITEHNLSEADNAYRRALSLDPASGFAWDGLGLVQYNGGRLADARQSFQRAVSRDPDSARAAYHIALVDQREGHLAAAIPGFRKALDLSPDDVEIARDLGAALLAAHQPSEAVPYLRLAASQAPDDPDAHRALATALGAAGQSADARTEMRRVVELSPANGEAWLDLCLLSIDVRAIESAREACSRAKALRADPNRLAFALRALEQFGIRN